MYALFYVLWVSHLLCLWTEVLATIVMSYLLVPNTGGRHFSGLVFRDVSHESLSFARRVPDTVKSTWLVLLPALRPGLLSRHCDPEVPSTLTQAALFLDVGGFLIGTSFLSTQGGSLQTSGASPREFCGAGSRLLGSPKLSALLLSSASPPRAGDPGGQLDWAGSGASASLFPGVAPSATRCRILGKHFSRTLSVGRRVRWLL